MQIKYLFLTESWLCRGDGGAISVVGLKDGIHKPPRPCSPGRLFSRMCIEIHVHDWCIYMLECRDGIMFVRQLLQLFSLPTLSSLWLRRQSHVSIIALFFSFCCVIINHAAVPVTCLTSDLHVLTQSFPTLHQSCFFEILCTETWISWNCTPTSWRCYSSKSPISLIPPSNGSSFKKNLSGLLFGLPGIATILSFWLLTMLFRNIIYNILNKYI